MKLVVIEGPGKRETLKKYLGADYDVFATKGHVRDLPQKAFGVDLRTITPDYDIMPDKKEIVEDLKKKAKKAEKVLLATDPDREGEAISWHIAHILGFKPEDECRVEFNEISKNAVTKAIVKPRAIDENLVNAQQTRRILDRIVGYKLSPILCKKIKPSLSAGRVQSVALKLVVDRENEIINFKPEEYWNISVELAKKQSKFKAGLVLRDGKKIKITCKEDADQVKQDVDGSDYIVSKIKKSLTKSHAPAPFTTSTMQQDALNKLGMNLKKTSSCAQQLYEGVDIEGEGKVALITYIRTDSTRVSADAQKSAMDFITSTYGANYIPKTANIYKAKANAQDAHEAIRPISIERTPAKVQSSLSPENFKLYKLIYERFLASQMTEALYNSVSVDVNAKQYTFRAVGKTVEFPGYTIVYKDYSEEEKEGDIKIPKLEENEKVDFVNYIQEQKFTKPPARYTEASLVKEMEEKGIGRPATYAATITTLSSRLYVEKEGRYLKPTDLGAKVNDYLADYFKQVINVKFTADMESKLDKIAENGDKWQDVVTSFWNSFSGLLNKASANSGYIKVEPEKTDIICDKCGAHMVIRDGKYGKFLGCSNYPNCNNIMKMENKTKFENRVVGKCPDCGKDIVSKISKQGKVYYGCSGFPECKYYSWTKPTEDNK